MKILKIISAISCLIASMSFVSYATEKPQEMKEEKQMKEETNEVKKADDRKIYASRLEDHYMTKKLDKEFGGFFLNNLFNKLSEKQETEEKKDDKEEEHKDGNEEEHKDDNEEEQKDKNKEKWNKLLNEIMYDFIQELVENNRLEELQFILAGGWKNIVQCKAGEEDGCGCKSFLAVKGKVLESGKEDLVPIKNMPKYMNDSLKQNHMDQDYKQSLRNEINEQTKDASTSDLNPVDKDIWIAFKGNEEFETTKAFKGLSEYTNPDEEVQKEIIDYTQNVLLTKSKDSEKENKIKFDESNKYIDKIKNNEKQLIEKTTDDLKNKSELLASIAIFNTVRAEEDDIFSMPDMMLQPIRLRALRNIMIEVFDKYSLNGDQEKILSLFDLSSEQLERLKNYFALKNLGTILWNVDKHLIDYIETGTYESESKEVKDVVIANQELQIQDYEEYTVATNFLEGIKKFSNSEIINRSWNFLTTIYDKPRLEIAISHEIINKKAFYPTFLTIKGTLQKKLTDIIVAYRLFGIKITNAAVIYEYLTQESQHQHLNESESQKLAKDFVDNLQNNSLPYAESYLKSEISNAMEMLQTVAAENILTTLRNEALNVYASMEKRSDFLEYFVSEMGYNKDRFEKASRINQIINITNNQNLENFLKNSTIKKIPISIKSNSGQIQININVGEDENVNEQTKQTLERNLGHELTEVLLEMHGRELE